MSPLLLRKGRDVFMKKIITIISMLSKRNLIILLSSCLLGASTLGFVVIKKVFFTHVHQNSQADLQQRINDLEAALAKALADVDNFSKAIKQKQTTPGNTKEHEQEIEQLKKELNQALKNVDNHKKSLDDLQKQMDHQQNQHNVPTSTTTIYQTDAQEKPSDRNKEQTNSENYGQDKMYQELNDIKEKASLCKALDNSIKDFDEKHPDVAEEINKKNPQREQNAFNSGATSTPARHDLTTAEGRQQINERTARALDGQKDALMQRELEMQKREITAQVIASAKQALTGLR